MSEWKSTYKNKTTGEIVHVKNLGLGEKKIKKSDGTEEKITVATLKRDFDFEDSTDQRIKNIAKKRKLSAFDRR